MQKALYFITLVVTLGVVVKAQPYISLRSFPDVTSDGEHPLCPDVTQVQFTCKGVNLVFLSWLVNGHEIADFQIGDSPQSHPIPSGVPRFRVQLISFSSNSNNILVGNFTSILSTNISVLNTNDVINCGDNRGREMLVVSYTNRSAPPVPVFTHEVHDPSTLTVIWDDTFTTTHGVDKYIVTVIDQLNASCFTDCGDPSTSCTCTLPNHTIFTARAINCGDQMGPASDPLILPMNTFPTVCSNRLSTGDLTAAVISAVVTTFLVAFLIGIFAGVLGKELIMRCTKTTKNKLIKKKEDTQRSPAQVAHGHNAEYEAVLATHAEYEEVDKTCTLTAGDEQIGMQSNMSYGYTVEQKKRTITS